MKKEIHPEYGEAKVTCACGHVFSVRSTRKEMRINTCSACHPFFTGKSALADATGRIEQFRKRYGTK